MRSTTMRTRLGVTCDKCFTGEACKRLKSGTVVCVLCLEDITADERASVLRVERMIADEARTVERRKGLEARGLDSMTVFALTD